MGHEWNEMGPASAASLPEASEPDTATREHMDRWAAGEVTHRGEEYDEMDRKLGVVREWIDTAPANAARDPEARTWGRLAKVAEEAGEVVTAYIGVTGQNPRKGVSHTMDDVVAELLDVAVTALVAYVHVRPGDSPMRALEEHVNACMKQADLT